MKTEIQFHFLVNTAESYPVFFCICVVGSYTQGSVITCFTFISLDCKKIVHELLYYLSSNTNHKVTYDGPHFSTCNLTLQFPSVLRNRRKIAVGCGGTFRRGKQSSRFDRLHHWVNCEATNVSAEGSDVQLVRLALKMGDICSLVNTTVKSLESAGSYRARRLVPFFLLHISASDH